MATYKIEWKQAAIRDLKKLDRQHIPRIVEAVESLKENPYQHGIKKLVGSEHTFRLRVGDFRVVFDICESVLIVNIVRVRHRRDVYRA